IGRFDDGVALAFEEILENVPECVLILHEKDSVPPTFPRVARDVVHELEHFIRQETSGARRLADSRRDGGRWPGARLATGRSPRPRRPARAPAVPCARRVVAGPFWSCVSTGTSRTRRSSSISVSPATT